MARARDLSFRIRGFQHVHLTSVFGGAILAERPFLDKPTARVLPFFKNVTKAVGHRWVFSFNSFPYFDPTNHLDPGDNHPDHGTTCVESMRKATCMKAECRLPSALRAMRERINQLPNRGSNQLWLTETGVEWRLTQKGGLEKQTSNHK